MSDLENAISNKQKAVQLTDGLPIKSTRLSNLSTAQQIRLEQFGDLFDLANAISNQQKQPTAHRRQTPEKSGVLYLMNIGLSQQTRFKHLDDLSDLENAISKHFTSSDGHPSEPVRLSNLGIAQQDRFEHIGDLSNLEHTISNKQQAIQPTSDLNIYILSRYFPAHSVRAPERVVRSRECHLKSTKGSSAR